MTDASMRQIIMSSHFVRIVMLISHAWHSPIWQHRHPTVDLKTHLDNLHQLLAHEVCTQTASGQNFHVPLLALLDTLQAADPRLSATGEDRAWLQAIAHTQHARVVMLMLLTSIYSEPSYYTPEQLAAQGAWSIEEWQERAQSVPGAFQAGGRWWLPALGLRAIGVAVDPHPQRRIVDPEAQEKSELRSS